MIGVWREAAATFACLLSALALGFLPLTAAAQAPISDGGTQQQRGTSAEEQIVVLGPVADLPTSPALQTEQRRLSRRLGASAAMFLRCSKLPDRSALSTILDGPPRAQRTQAAIHRFIGRNKSCYPDYPNLPSPELGKCNAQFSRATPEHQICRVTFDRGALFERTLLEIVGDLRLTRGNTFDPAVLRRFAERESARNLGRDMNDRRFFETVACMVQILPEQGVAMLLSAPASPRAEEARRLLIGYGAPCVGFAKDVRADPDQFRAYVAEAVYSWLAAARGTDSLVATGRP